MINLFKGIIPAFGLIGLLTACDKADPLPQQNESEVISKVQIVLIDSVSGNRTMYAYTDPDGDGGQPPTIDTVLVVSGRTYYGALRVFDVTLADTIELTGEIEDEAEDHQLFYSAPSNLRIASDRADKDSNGIYIGLKTVWRAGAIGDGPVKVTLKHQPGLKKDGPKPDGDPAKGETDVEVVFPAKVI